MNTSRRIWQDGNLTVSDQCKRCFKDIAMQLYDESLCCECRYGEFAPVDKRNHAVEIEMIDWYSWIVTNW